VVRGGDGLRLRNSGGLNWVPYAHLLLVSALGGYIVIFSLVNRHRAASTDTFIYVLVLGGSLLTVALLFLPGSVRQLRPVRVTRAQVRLIRGLRSVTIPTANVTGVGLLLRHTPGVGQKPLTGWYLTVWDGAGAAHQVNEILYPVSGLAAGAEPSVSDADPAAIAASKAGVAARQLHAFIAGVQGPDGELARHEQQEHPAASSRWAPTLTCGYWSPNGRISEVGRRATGH
jgi:hypothetical protein